MIYIKHIQNIYEINGNQSRKFLKCLDQLEFELMSEGGEDIIKGLPFIKALDRVVSLCFGILLDPAYVEAIQDFKKSYLDLGITVTPKVL